MDVLISDNECAATSQKVKDTLHMYCIESCTSEPHDQHQNMVNAVLGASKISPVEYSPSLVPLVIFGYYVSCM